MATKIAKTKRRTTWVRRVSELMHEIESWARQEKWSIHRIEKNLDEESIGSYTVPALHLRSPDGELYVTPVALDVMGADGLLTSRRGPP
jgi:hypothetical protein